LLYLRQWGGTIPKENLKQKLADYAA